MAGERGAPVNVNEGPRPTLPARAFGVARRYFEGFAYPFRGLAFLVRRPRLWVWVVVPVTLMIAMLGGAAVIALTATPWLLSFVVDRPPGGPGFWLALASAAWFTAAALIGLLLFAVAAVVLWVVSTLVATPFYDLLAERVEWELLGVDDRPFELAVVLKDAARSIAHTLVALLLYAAAMLPVALIGLVPILGEIVGPIAGGVLTVTFLARELLDMPLARRRVSFGTKMRFLWDHLALMEGFGTAAMLMLWIPLLNFFSMPVAVVGGTLLYCRLERQGQGVPRGTRGGAA
jgi:CysZ protein